eukprot:TRINITY_DN6715_c0_g1_i2.p1 TRINITY_DN6715_c0_g1~~TRINITY_DN6715_c0_g1_i2.p1  ORF type:complete len:216 (+),score=37.88 TRINITY_DN6715_c0_g1_i2:99-746(+)
MKDSVVLMKDSVSHFMSVNHAAFHKLVGMATDGPVHMTLGQAIIDLAFLALLAAIYRKYKSWPSEDAKLEQRALQQWSSGHFDCFSDMNTCAMSCCCPHIQWADSVDMVGLLKFWPAFLACASLMVLGQTKECALLAFVLLAVLVYYRQEMRKLFNMEGQGEAKTVCADCLFVSCCTCCAIAQEARHVKYAAQINHEVVQAQKKLLEAPEQQSEP